MQALALLLLLATFPADPPKKCDSCAGWNKPRAPFRVFGNTYFVGVAELSSVLITSPAGHILLDGDLPQSAEVIDAHIRALGFRTGDVKLILASHAHFDHVGGIAALQRVSHARVVASASAAAAMQRGLPPADDPQIGLGEAFMSFPRVAEVETVRDGQTLRVGDLAVTAHLTPGHTSGGTTWTWRSCEGASCVDIVYADSLNPVSADAYRFTGATADTLRHSIDVVRALPCDILLTVHPGFAGLDEKLVKRATHPAKDPFLDPSACRAYADDAERRLDERLATETPH